MIEQLTFDFLKEIDKQVEVKIITTKETEQIVLSYKQLVVILEALHNYKIEVENLKGEDEANARHQYKINEINEIFNYLEHGMKYNFEDAVNKCTNKWRKNLKGDDPGMETFGWLGGANNEKL